jgi:hypothetical protein
LKLPLPTLLLLGLTLGPAGIPCQASPELAATAAAGFPADYRGRPFDDAAYRSELAVVAGQPRLPYQAFAPTLTLWDGSEPDGEGWLGPEESGATLRLGDADATGRRVIHYNVVLGNYRYAAFGWRWAARRDRPAGIDLRSYDAVSFSIRVTGPKKPQELFFGVSDAQPLPVSLRDYDPDFTDGSWHRITLPIRHMQWTGTEMAETAVRGFFFKTFVWEPAEYDIELDHFTLDRAASLAPAAKAKVTPAARPGQAIPGKIECAFYDLGGEGVAYHDTTPINTLSAVLNQQRRHQRAHATAYEWNFRREEGVDISYVKDWADLNHPNLVDPPVNQLYLGGAEDGEWCNYTVNVKQPGTYRIFAAYGNDANGQTFQLSLNHRPASTCRVPVVTGSMHKWNRAEVGTITFAQAGAQLLTLHYGRGFNLGYLEFSVAPNVAGAAGNTAPKTEPQ